MCWGGWWFSLVLWTQCFMIESHQHPGCLLFWITPVPVPLILVICIHRVFQFWQSVWAWLAVVGVWDSPAGSILRTGPLHRPFIRFWFPLYLSQLWLSGPSFKWESSHFSSFFVICQLSYNFHIHFPCFHDLFFGKNSGWAGSIQICLSAWESLQNCRTLYEEFVLHPLCAAKTPSSRANQVEPLQVWSLFRLYIGPRLCACMCLREREWEIVYMCVCETSYDVTVSTTCVYVCVCSRIKAHQNCYYFWRVEPDMYIGSAEPEEARPFLFFFLVWRRPKLITGLSGWWVPA